VAIAGGQDDLLDEHFGSQPSTLSFETAPQYLERKSKRIISSRAREISGNLKAGWDSLLELRYMKHWVDSGMSWQQQLVIHCM